MKWPLAVAASLLNLFLLALAGGLLLLTTVPLEIDGTPHKEYLLPAVQKHTGLAVGVDGEIRLEIGPRLGLRVEGLQVANPESPGSPQLLAAELAALRIDTAALLAGALRPNRLELEGASLLLERLRRLPELAPPGGCLARARRLRVRIRLAGHRRPERPHPRDARDLRGPQGAIGTAARSRHAPRSCLTVSGCGSTSMGR